MATLITREVLESYLLCRSKGHMKMTGGRGRPTDYELLLRDSRRRVCEAATARLLAGDPAEDVPRDCTITSEVLKRGAPLLLDVTVQGEGFSLCYDALRKVAGTSGLGNFYYVPVLCHESEGPTREQRTLLELLGLILGTVQGRDPESGLLFHGPGCRGTKLKLHPGGRPIRRLFEQFRAFPSADRPPQLVLNSHCQVCEFREQCHAEAKGRDDLSLLRGMSEGEVAKWGRRGIFTVTQLSCTFRARKRKPREGQKRQPHQRALQAKAVTDQKIYVLGTPDLPASSNRIYLDLEGDPERSFVYLLGLVIEANGTEERFSYWADTPDGELALFHRLLHVVDRHPDARIYTYGSYEAAFIRRIVRESGQSELKERLLSRLVNVLSVVHSHVYFPTYSNGLKEVAGYLGFRWTEPSASGVQSMVWRRRWEETGAEALKEMLTLYNLEDCAALRRVTQALYAICSPPSGEEAQPLQLQGRLVSRVEEIDPALSRRQWGTANFSVPDFDFVNERAYFDYQRDRVFIRTNEALKRIRARELRGRGKKRLRATRSVEIIGERCPHCGSTDLTRKPDGRLYRLALDLRFTRSGIRRQVTRFTTTRHRCRECGRWFVPQEYRRLGVHFHALKSWAMYKHVAHRMSFENIAQEIRECFRLPVYVAHVCDFKPLLSNYYEETYRKLVTKVVGGAMMHADETEVHLKQKGKGYVWVFTNLEEVVFLYRGSREGGFLQDLLKDFRGVLVSDFYAAYDSLECHQQKCLIHLIRDFNHDIQRNPWDEELKVLAADFGGLLRKTVATTDRYGLKARHLGRHQRDVDRFFEQVSCQSYRSEVTEGYRKRLLKYRAKLFTFLAHDGVPWNNNNAEHAVKEFAYYRETTNGRLTETGLAEFLVLLSVCVTCQYKGVSFLKFMLSGERDIDVFRASRGRMTALPEVQVLPEGINAFHRDRKVCEDR
jgi:predicted RecB family nuclease